MGAIVPQTSIPGAATVCYCQTENSN